MSAVAPLLKPFGLRSPEKTAGRSAPRSRPRLVLIAAPARRAGRVPFAILIGAILVGGLVTLLMLHTMAAQDGFKVSALQQQQKTLNDQLQSLEQVVQADAAPGTLRKKAAALGMLPSVVDSYRRLPDGRTVGVETPVYPAAPVVTSPSTTSKQTVTTTSGTDKSTSTASAGTSTTGTTSTTSTAGPNATGTAAKAGKHQHGTGTANATSTGPAATTTSPKHHSGHSQQ